MLDRKAELEMKKAKLAHIRSEKEDGRKERKVSDAQSVAKSAVPGIKRDDRQAIDKNLESLGSTPVAAAGDSISSLPSSYLESDISTSSTPDYSSSQEISSAINGRCPDH